MPDDDRMEGSMKKMKGSMKEGTGRMVGDTKLQAEGKAEKTAGWFQNAIGGIKDALFRRK
jgi:uncharacterized protein YjbJ (UPF0337 family)